MGKASKKRHLPQSQLKITKKKRTKEEAFREADHSDDEIDEFHRHCDLIPLDVSQDESDDGDMEQPVFNFQGDDSDESRDEDNDYEDDDAEEGDTPPRGFAANIVRQAKYLKQKFGGEDEMDDDEDENDKEVNKKSWGGRKNIYYNADTADDEIESSDEELRKEEEAEVLRIQRESAKSLSMADLGLQDSAVDESDSDKKTQGCLQDEKPKGASKWHTLDASYEEIKKDVGALSKEEQMDVVFSSAPELIGLLSELNEAVDQLKEVNDVDYMGKAALDQSEAKEALLLIYCQAISSYLLLKSEGLSVRDHPIKGHLVEIKNMLQKLKEIEGRDSSPTEQTAHLSKKADTRKIGVAQVSQHQEKLSKMVSSDKLEDKINQQQPVKATAIQNAKHKDQDVKIGPQSLEMLKIRANLEAKLRKKGLYNSKTKLNKSSSIKLTNRSFSSDDFGDELQNAKSISKSKLSQLVINKVMVKLASGDDDLPKRDDIGERRRKHELRVLGRIGVNKDNEDDGNHDDHNNNNDKEVHGDVPDDDDEASEDEFYKQAKRKRVEKLINRQQLNAAKQIVPSLDEAEQQADGKCHISYQMNKNKGLTRHRKKDLKNPRKKYRAKHSKWEKRRKGQVRDIRRASVLYGGESSGINPFVSHSVRF
ncbi:Something about silencing protein 10 [Rhynchospora pubera]|uniref:Something about silencing protein 10 n=1 Tax=Rhynchospora pubera TaxID=906938 RepID=A0AAV8BSM4_9POAL|nr:Something about silencing protein 10 [Rhynchospora pubera]